MSLRIVTAEPDDFRARVLVPLPERRVAFVAEAPRPTVDIVVPVPNQERDLARSVRRLHAYLAAEFPFTARITITDNIGGDRTLAIASELAAELPEVRVLHLNEKGRGRALAAAWLTSEARVVTSMDGTLSPDPAVLMRLVAPVISKHGDMSIASPGRLKALRADVARWLIPKVVNRNRFFDAELLVRAELAGLRILRFRSNWRGGAERYSALPL